MSLHRSSLHHTASSTGGTSRGVIKGKRTFNLWRLPATDVACHPVLSSLPEELSKFAYAYLRRSLIIPLPSDVHGRPSVEELNNVLINHLHERSGQHIRVWYTLDIESDLCIGVQLVRCNPFKSRNDKTYGRNSRSTLQQFLPRNTQAFPLDASTWRMWSIGKRCGLGELSSFFAVPLRVLAVACSTWIWP
jgi:hypothetical protein